MRVDILLVYSIVAFCFNIPNTEALFARICEGDTETLECPFQQHIIVRYAGYGRLLLDTCSILWKGVGKCKPRDATEKIKGMCNGRRTCEITAGNHIVGDPCGFTNKYLDVDYDCIKSECDPPPRIDGLIVEIPENVVQISVGTSIILRCENKTNFMEIICVEDGKWSNSSGLVCSKNEKSDSFKEKNSKGPSKALVGGVVAGVVAILVAVTITIFIKIKGMPKCDRMKRKHWKVEGNKNIKRFNVKKKEPEKPVEKPPPQTEVELIYDDLVFYEQPNQQAYITMNDGSTLPVYNNGSKPAEREQPPMYTELE